MKKILFVLFAISMLASSLYSQNLEEQRRQYLREKLVFYYIDNPAAAKPKDFSAFEVNKSDIADNKDIASPLWTNPNNVGLKNLVIKLLRSSANGGDAKLQRVVRDVLLITDKKVLVFLYNDIPNTGADTSWIYCYNSNYAASNNKASWPCASPLKDRTSQVTGVIGIGAYFFSPTRPASSGGWSDEGDKGHVFTHELVHTQVPLVLEPSLGKVNMYGPDGNHSFNELLPSRNSAFNEGIATSFAFRYYLPSWTAMTKWYNDNKVMYLDNLSGCSSPPPLHCLQTRLNSASVAAEASCGTGATCYKIRNLPAPIIMHCENVSANVLYQYMQQFGSELMLVSDIKKAVAEMAKSSNYTFAPLFKQMVKSGLDFRNRNAGAGVTTFGQLLPIGILDYYTGYKVTSKADLESVFGVTWDKTYTNVDDYFSSKRNVLTGFRANANTWDVGQQLDKFAEHLSVKIAAPVATSGKN